ncbi:DnaJ protein, subfamily C, member 9 [Rhizodiscina lignyota]|uniref:DnaJ protein, subfamily C, member 9 n=1 Tax=Rhizodiscina lignyota TaxID=1504668 RepID=A0A9P4I380_9PEZI|nr:DnaJ protein, subfamily C, member 9 [Rhizodiscina lignyota]
MAPKSEELADAAPTSINPYEVLGLAKDASADEVKTAYRKAALKHHPDKASPEEKDAAHTKFQEVAFAYAILSDPRRRSRYDTTGRTEESLNIEDDDFNWTDFFRTQFKEVVTSEAIAKFKAEYQGSEEERTAVIAAYEDGEGDMDRVYEDVMLSNPLEDDERFRKILDEEIEAGRIEALKKYTKESKKSKQQRISKAKKEEEDAREMAREMGVEDDLFGDGDVEVEISAGAKKGKKKKVAAGSEDALAAIIKKRQQGREQQFLADLEEKYAPKSKKGRKREAMDEPPEEAFQKTAERMQRAKASKSSDDAPKGGRRSKRTKT